MVPQNEVMSNTQLNRAIARTEDEFTLFEKLDAEFPWPDASFNATEVRGSTEPGCPCTGRVQSRSRNVHTGPL